MFDFVGEYRSDKLATVPDHGHLQRGILKTLFDLSVATMLLVPLVAVAVTLLVLNPFLNAGPLIFRQERMGLDCRSFTAYKFRTMRCARVLDRGAFDQLEAERITKFGQLLRKARLDELPQILNVLRGDMSMIGPRPDCFAHASVYLAEIPGYAQRHAVLPGISGIAQTEIGYVDGIEGITRKVEADLYYLKHKSFRLDLWITWRTICVVASRRGA